MGFEQERVVNLDACIKCSACTAHCPVAAVYPLFPGPKSIGPDAERFRLQGLEMDTTSLEYCSNCKTCEVTCPSGVKITEITLRAREKAQANAKKKRNLNSLFKDKTLQLYVRDLVLGRAEYLGRIGTICPSLINTMLRVSLVRGLMERTLGINRQAPLPVYQQKFNRKTKAQQMRPEISKRVVYFPGCFVTYNDALTGQAIVKVLEHNGYEVIVPSFHCCGVPLQANGHFREARDNARKNLALLNPYLQAGVPVITGCTSCGLALKEEYSNTKASEGLKKATDMLKDSKAAGAELIGPLTYDVFEFLWGLHERNELCQDFREVHLTLGYHAPCHLKAQGIGTPSLRLLRLIPGVSVKDLDTGCCGLSGSFGFKQEKYNLAMSIGSPLFDRVKQGKDNGEFQSITTECGGCQVQIKHGSGVKTEHPIWTLMKAYGIKISKA